jgi:hypothetical protein
MSERRKRRRFELQLRCVITTVSSGLTTNGETKNVSSSGVLFTSEEPVPVGALIDCLIAFPRFRRARRDVQLRCVGTVLREDPNLAFAASLDRYEFVRISGRPKKKLTD